ncbi:hypothetical protein GL981_12970 (plasmid) [Spiroplasma citri]|nr:hypothetical protein GL981_12970 [Spiroplasma citri]
MTEQIKIMDMINRWGYLNLEQVALLLNKNKNTVEKQLYILINKNIGVICDVWLKLKFCHFFKIWRWWILLFVAILSKW